MALVEGAVFIWDEGFEMSCDVFTPAVDGMRREVCFPDEEEVKANREKYAGRLARFLLLDARFFVAGEFVLVWGEEGLARRVDPLWFAPSDNSSSAPEEGGVGERAREGALRGAPRDERTGEDAPESEARTRRG